MIHFQFSVDTRVPKWKIVTFDFKWIRIKVEVNSYTELNSEDVFDVVIMLYNVMSSVNILNVIWNKDSISSSSYDNYTSVGILTHGKLHKLRFEII